MTLIVGFDRQELLGKTYLFLACESVVAGGHAEV